MESYQEYFQMLRDQGMDSDTSQYHSERSSDEYFTSNESSQPPAAQPSTSGIQQGNPQSSAPQPSTSGIQRGNPQPSTSGTQRFTTSRHQQAHGRNSTSSDESDQAVTAFIESARTLDTKFLPVKSIKMPGSRKRKNIASRTNTAGITWNTPLPPEDDSSSADDTSVRPRKKKRKINVPTSDSEDSGIEIDLKKVNHRQEKKFGFLDDLYSVDFRYDGLPPTVLSLFLAICTALNLILNEVRKKLEADRDHLVYPCISEDSIKNGINGGPVRLNQSNTEIINKLLDRMHHFLKSHQSMQITDSFKLSMKVLSHPHTTLMNARRLIGLLEDPLVPLPPQERRTQRRRRSHILPSPVGYKRGEDCFEGQCAIISCILGKAHNNHCKDPTDRASYPANIKSFINKDSQVLKIKRTGHWLESKLNSFFRDNSTITQSKVGYPAKINETLQKYYNVQIHIFASSTEKFKIASYPDQYDPCMEQIYLLQTQTETDVLHYEAITDLAGFFNFEKRRFCFDCQKILSSKEKHFRHTCYKRRFCLCCRRKCLTPEVWYTNSKLFCDQREGQIYGICDKCNLEFKSYDCQKSHRAAECNRGIRCKLCDKYLPISSQRPKLAEALMAHKCGETKCPICHETFMEGSSHICSLKKQEQQKDWNKISFLSFSFLKKGPKDDENVPAQACLVYECKSAGNFAVKMFHGSQETSTKEGFENIYWPSSIERKLNENGKKGNFGKYKKHPSYLTNDFYTQGDLAKEVLGMLFTNKSYQNSTIVMPTQDDLFAILSGLVNLNIVPTVLRNDDKILSVAANNINIRFVCFQNFQGPVSTEEMCNITKQTNLNPFFPKNIKLRKLRSASMFVSYADFMDFNDSRKTKNQKLAYIDSLSSIYSFELNGLDYLYTNTLALAQMCFMYMEESFSFQQELMTHLNTTSMNTSYMQIINPLSDPYVSNGSFIYGVFRLFCMNKFDIGCIPKENVGLTCDRVSKPEAQYVYYLNKNKTIRAFHNHIDGQTRDFAYLYPDAYDKATSTVYFFNGCYYHHHSPKQCLAKKKPVDKEKQKEDMEKGRSKDEFYKRLHLFKESYPGISVVVKWECTWRQDLEDPIVKTWFESNPWAFNPPLHRLIPRDAVRGGTSETFRFEWVKGKNVDETLFYADVTSQYPDIALNHTFPTGPFEVVIGEGLGNIRIEAQSLKFKNKDLYGIIFLSLEAPSNCMYPFLLHRTKDLRSVAALCKTCANEQIFGTCTHTGMDKFLTGAYTTLEINYALSLGYKIKHIYEAWHWSNREAIFQQIMQLLLRKKVMFSGFPDDVHSDSDKEEYCTKVNNTLNLSDSLALSPCDIVYNERLKKYYKLLTVSIVGKIGQGNVFPRDVFIKEGMSIESYFHSTTGDIQNIDLINCDTLYLKFKLTKENAPINRTGNCVVQAMVTAQARINMHKTLRAVVGANCKLYSMEADAIVFSQKTNAVCPIKFGNQIGDFKEEYKNIKSYSTLGPKTSSVVYFEKEETQSIVKIKGLNLKGEIAGNYVTNDVYDQQVSHLLNGIASSTKVPQSRTFTKLSNCTKRMTLREQFFSNTVLKSRKLIYMNHEHKTFPYGYNM